MKMGLLDSKQLAKHLGINVHTVYNYQKKGWIVAEEKEKGKRMYNPLRVDAELKKRKRQFYQNYYDFIENDFSEYDNELDYEDLTIERLLDD